MDQSRPLNISGAQVLSQTVAKIGCLENRIRIEHEYTILPLNILPGLICAEGSGGSARSSPGKRHREKAKGLDLFLRINPQEPNHPCPSPKTVSKKNNLEGCAVTVGAPQHGKERFLGMGRLGWVSFLAGR